MSSLILTHIPRWVYSSVRKYMKDNTGGIITHIEGENIVDLARPRVEFRLDGPRLRQKQGCWEVWIAVNFVITTELGGNTFEDSEKAGILAEALNTSIPVYRYGNGADDDDSLLGCLEIVQDKLNYIRIFPLGNPDPALKLEQTIVEARYTMDLEGG